DDDFDVEDLGDAGNQPFGEREAGREGFEVARRRHHYRVGDAVEHERDGEFLANRIRPRLARGATVAYDRALLAARALALPGLGGLSSLQLREHDVFPGGMRWRKAVGVEPTRERLTPPTGFEVRPHHRMRVPSS